MIEWTERANEVWKRYCEEVRMRLANTGADAEEVIEDVARHIEAEMSGAKVITKEDVRRITGRIGMAAAESRSVVKEVKAYKKPGVVLLVICALFGVLLPLGAVGVELLTRICSSVFFDPVPTPWYLALFVTIPVSNVVCCVTIWGSGGRHAGIAGFVNAVGLGAAIVYSIMFLPILPISAVAVMAYGLGLCGLAPLLSLVVVLLVRSELKKAGGGRRVGGFWTGLCASLALFAVAALPGFFTHLGLQMALSDSTARRGQGIRMLRAVGDEGRLLEMCYREGEGLGGNLFSAILFDGSMPTNDVRGVYYRVTGKAFNAMRPPQGGFRTRGVFEDWDFEQGGDTVGGRIKDLSLISSRLDGSVDADAALGYIEWTMVFKNTGYRQREARTQIQLPAGAVVSRLTLWINGEEREAAFGRRSQTREAYQNVVQRQRDPVLVTTAGPDRVLLQCFPVQPNGEMKVRVGITAPAHLLRAEEAVLSLPYMNERNFKINSDMKHSVWIESTRPVVRSTVFECVENGNAPGFVIRTSLADDALQSGSGVVLERDGGTAWAWTADERAGEGRLIVQRINPTSQKGPQRVVAVVDSSVGMGDTVTEALKAFDAADSQIELTVVVADDEVRVLSEGSEAVGGIAFVGGKDNVPALEKAWDIAAESTDAVTVWIHGAQPHLFEPVEGLVQRWERRPGGPRLIDVQVGPGPNKVVAALDGVVQVHSLVRTGDLAEDVALLLRQWRGEAPTFALDRRRVEASEKPAEHAKQTSLHLARLWARDEIDRLRQEGGKENTDRALRLALNYQLVTPVSGAVVLETAAQYKAAGLEPVDPETVPTIPEPEVWALLIVAGVVLAWVVLREKRRVRAA